MSSRAGLQGVIAVVPLTGNWEAEDAYALGALFSRLLGRHLQAAGLQVVPDSTLVRHMAAQQFELPLSDEQCEALRQAFKAQAVVGGQYVLDEDGKLFGVRLEIDRDDVETPPVEASTPLAMFPRFVEHVALAVVEMLDVPIDDALRRRVRAASRPGQFEVFRQVAQAQTAWARGQHELALGAVSAALEIDGSYEDALALQTAAARAAGDSETARTAFQRWSAAAVKAGRPLDGAERLMMLGHWLRDAGEWADARRAYDGAQSLFERERDEVGVARAHNNIANVDLMLGKVQTAIKSYRRSLRIFETHANTQRDTATALLNLSLAHKNLGQRDEALVAVEQAVTLARGLQDVQLEARCYAQRGSIQHDMGHWMQAEEDYTRAVGLLEAASDAADLAMVKSHLALLQKQQGSYQRAEALLLEALAVLKRQPHVHEQAVVWLNLADLYYAMRLYAQAWDYAEQALAVFTRLACDCQGQARDLLAALERTGEAPTGVEEATLPAQDVGSAGGLYNDSNLYHNEYSDEDSGDGDAGVNSSVGRTPKL